MRHDPIPLPLTHAPNCHCPRCAPWRGAVSPAEQLAMVVGLGLGLWAVLLLTIAKAWPIISAAVAGAFR